jgi:menaquinone-dependent protoporphyrinogen oxidase
MKMNKILVAYATNAGSTADVARTVGEELQKTGAQVDVLPLEQVTDLSSYQSVVLGAPVIMGWHPGATAFLKKNQPALSKVPVALFLTCVNLTQTDETSVDGVPVFVDEKLPTAPQNAGRLSPKERHTTVNNYVQPILKAAPAVKPVSVGVFGGRLDIDSLSIFQKLFVIVIIQAKSGEKRNWDAIRAWAGGLFTTEKRR